MFTDKSENGVDSLKHDHFKAWNTFTRRHVFDRRLLVRPPADVISEALGAGVLRYPTSTRSGESIIERRPPYLRIPVSPYPRTQNELSFRYQSHRPKDIGYKPEP